MFSVIDSSYARVIVAVVSFCAAQMIKNFYENETKFEHQVERLY